MTDDQHCNLILFRIATLSRFLYENFCMCSVSLSVHFASSGYIMCVGCCIIAIFLPWFVKDNKKQ